MDSLNKKLSLTFHMDALSIQPTEPHQKIEGPRQVEDHKSGSRQVATSDDPAIHTHSENDQVTAKTLPYYPGAI